MDIFKHNMSLTILGWGIFVGWNIYFYDLIDLLFCNFSNFCTTSNPKPVLQLLNVEANGLNKWSAISLYCRPL